ncbi:MAG: cation:proton antiporter [archaeon]
MIVETAFLISAIVIGILILVCLIRAALGPTTPDRIVALDTINTLAVAALVLLGAGFRQVLYVDVAIVYAMLSFVTTLYISKYLEDTKR